MYFILSLERGINSKLAYRFKTVTLECPLSQSRLVDPVTLGIPSSTTPTFSREALVSLLEVPTSCLDQTTSNLLGA